AAASVLVALGALVLAGYGLGLSRTDLSYHRVGEFTRHWSYAVVALGVVLPAVFGRAAGGAVRGFLASAPMQFLGRISYGIYLWQIVVIGRWVSAPSYTGEAPGAARYPGQQFNVGFWPTLAWTFVVTVVLATLTWYLVERPWLRHRNRPLGTFVGGMWAIAVASFAARIWSFGTALERNPGNGDPFFYHAQANMLADGVGFGEPIQWLTEGRFVPSAIHPPLFTLWLTPSSLLGARGFLSHKTMAALAGVAVVVVAGLLARRLTNSDRAGLVGAALVAVYPNLWMIDGTLWPEGLYTALVGATLLAAYRWRDAPTLAGAVLVGAGVGLAVLTRGEALLLLPLLCLPLAWSARARLPRWPVHALVMGAVALALLAPWTVRNLLRFDRPVPVSTNSEEVLYYANCPDTYAGPFIGYWSFNCQERERAERVAAGLPADPPGDEAERAAAWGELGREYAQENRDRWPAVGAARVSRVWDLRYAENSARAIALEGRPLEWSKAGLWVYRLLLVPGLVGLWVIHRRGRPVWPLVAMLAMITVTAVYAYGHIRFRTVGDLVLIVGAAATIDALLPRRARRTARPPDTPLAAPVAHPGAP
ncbi:MAG TPA: glycosyltransferase family 39 protein, partial [Aquihabitans sp.]|nr:glycosyltransferase family 39 protein [Aquihabitans sp.]